MISQENQEIIRAALAAYKNPEKISGLSGLENVQPLLIKIVAIACVLRFIDISGIDLTGLVKSRVGGIWLLNQILLLEVFVYATRTARKTEHHTPEEVLRAWKQDAMHEDKTKSLAARFLVNGTAVTFGGK